MYRVVIADDEEPVLDSFSFIFKKDVIDFQISGFARTGTEAVVLIKEHKPDLVFMDIRMPGIDGLEAIRQVKQQFPGTVFILATAYERFDIAKKAIPLGIFSYMVKPISRRALVEKLNEVKVFLDHEKEKNDNRLETVKLLEKTRNEKRQRYLSGLIFKNPSAAEWEDLSALFALKTDRAAIYLIGITGAVSESMREKIFQSITRKLQYKIGCISGMAGERLLILVTEEKNSHEITRCLKRILDNWKDFEFICGAGEFHHYSQLTESFQQAFAPFANMSKAETSWFCEQKKIQELCRTILKSDREAGFRKFEEFRIELFNLNDFAIAKGKMIAFFTLFFREIGRNVPAEGSLNTDIVKEITTICAPEELNSWSARTMFEILSIMENYRSSSYPQPLLKAMTYIKENYDSQIQLSSAAEECMISSSYLSHLFSEHLDTTFIDYLNRFRLKKAMTLLQEEDKSIKEVSYSVGYQDPNYFSRIFRKYMGFAPSDIEKGVF